MESGSDLEVESRIPLQGERKETEQSQASPRRPKAPKPFDVFEAYFDSSYDAYSDHSNFLEPNMSNQRGILAQAKTEYSMLSKTVLRVVGSF